MKNINIFKKMDVVNNYSIKAKLLMIYIFCVLIPVVVTNSVVYLTVKSHEVKEQKISMEHAMDRVKYNLGTVLDDCILVSDHLQSDLLLNEFINKRYDKPIEYYDRYNFIMENNAINYYYNSQHVYQITIYADNNTIINSGNFQKLTPQICQTDWYKQFSDNKKEMTISVYYDKNTDNSLSNNTRRKISIVRKLDHFGSTHENILKIDVDYNVLLSDILNEKMEGNLYICNKNYILFSNIQANSAYNELETIDSIKEKNVKLKDKFRLKIPNEEWNIIITANEINPFSKIAEIKEVVIGLIIFNLLLPTIIITLVSHSIRYRLIVLNTYLGKVENEEFATIESSDEKDEIGKLIRSYNLMVLKIKELIEVVFRRDAEKQRLELAKKQAELKALQSQVNPHFMFNTLESIRMRSLIKEEMETAEIIEKLSILLRMTITWGEDYITIEDEMIFVENYLQIQKYRFGDKLSFNFNVMKDCKYIRIPKLSILSFVENACIHGVEEVSHNASVNISIFKDDINLFIEIFDTGGGISEEDLSLIMDKLNNAKIDMLNEGKSTGVLNTYMRLHMYWNDNMKFKIESKLKQWTKVTIKIGIEELEKQL